MDGEVVQEPKEDTGCLIWAALFMMAVFGSCANMPHYQKQYEQSKTVPHKIEPHQQISTNQVQQIRHSDYMLSR